MPCPCGTKLEYQDCCELYHNGLTKPETAEQLMRSRYSAFAKKNEQYVLDTWHISKRSNEINLKKDLTWWLGLEILNTSLGQAGDTTGEVEFIASYRLRKKEYKLHERSSFVKEGEQWFYVDGVLLK
ncbi:MAG: YchJ family protein [Cyanobacteria bacterium]|nr:YchJ family protein [Cyanobacteriota bacterium]MDA1021064.1 YchJ family protein [Cyanobacteriota bacterium]